MSMSGSPGSSRRGGGNRGTRTRGPGTGTGNVSSPSGIGTRHTAPGSPQGLSRRTAASAGTSGRGPPGQVGPPPAPHSSRDDEWVSGSGTNRYNDDEQNDGPHAGPSSAPVTRASSVAECVKDDPGGGPPSSAPDGGGQGLFHIISQLAALEGTLWSILEGLKLNASHVSFFCREYWGSSASQAQLSLGRVECNERLKRQIQQACVLESLGLAATAHLSSGVMDGVSVTVRSRLRNLLYYLHENSLVLLDFVCQRWPEEERRGQISQGHCPDNLNIDILVRANRYRRLRRGEHVMALRQHNEMITNVLRQLCRGAVSARGPPSGGRGPTSMSSQRASMSPPPGDGGVLAVVANILVGRTPIDRLRVGAVRGRMLHHLCFRALLSQDGAGDPDCRWPDEDPYTRYGAEAIGTEGPVIWFEPLPPMMPDLEYIPKLPPLPHGSESMYSLVLDLDETLVHYFEVDGMGSFGVRPGMTDFLARMHQLGYEIVIFTAATQDYADWVIDQIDPKNLVHHRLYRQHALPWGPIFVKDLSVIGRQLERTLIIDNVQENFMLQPHNGIFSYPWYDDPNDRVLYQLSPLLEELIRSRATVPDILDKYRDQVPVWAGWDQYFSPENDYTQVGDPDDDLAGPPLPDAEPYNAPPPAPAPGPPAKSSSWQPPATQKQPQQQQPSHQQQTVQQEFNSSASSQAASPGPASTAQQQVRAVMPPRVVNPSPPAYSSPGPRQQASVRQVQDEPPPPVSTAWGAPQQNTYQSPAQQRSQAAQQQPQQHTVAQAQHQSRQPQQQSQQQAQVQMHGYRPAASGITGAFQAPPPGAQRQNRAAMGPGRYR